MSLFDDHAVEAAVTRWLGRPPNAWTSPGVASGAAAMLDAAVAALDRDQLIERVAQRLQQSSCGLIPGYLTDPVANALATDVLTALGLIEP